MFKKFLVIVTACLLLASCATSNYVNSNSVITSTTLSVEEKFSSLGFDEVQVNKIESFFDGGAWAAKVEELVDNAENYILITSFLISESDSNESFYNALIEKAKQGVSIYLIQDGMTYFDYTETSKHYRQIQYLQKYGIHIHQFNPLSIGRLINPVGLLLRDHRKFIVVDGKYIATGGMNFSHISMLPFSEGGQRDSMHLFESPQMAKVFKRDFIDYWNSISYDTIDPQDIIDVDFDSNENNIKCWVYNQYLNSVRMPEFIGSLFYSAKNEILYIPLYPLLDDGMYQWVEDASSRGVRIEQILANSSNLPEYNAALYTEKEQIESGVTTYNEYINDITWHLLHEKLFIIDSRYVVIGSVNFNHRSMMLSEEVAIVIDDTEFASFMRDHFMSFKDNAYQVSPELADSYKNLLNCILYFIMYFGG